MRNSIKKYREIDKYIRKPPEFSVRNVGIKTLRGRYMKTIRKKN